MDPPLSVEEPLNDLSDYREDLRLADLSRSLSSYLSSSSGTKDTKIKALLRMAQSVNQTVLKLQAEKADVFKTDSSSEIGIAVASVIRDCVGKSQVQINRAIEELLKQDELFDEKSAKPIESDELMVASAERLLQGSPASSSVYVPRQPRLPGLPLPPADQFGEWDEYRDDLDPGYRVREVSEEEFESASQSTAVTQIGRGSIFSDDELSKVCVMDENDELSGAAASGATSFSKGQTPGSMSDFLGFSSIRSGDRARVDSPTFGGDFSKSRTSFLYDCMGNWKEVSQPVHADERGQRVKENNNRPLEELQLRVVYESGRTGFEASKEFDSTPGVLVAGKYRIEGHLGQAAFSKAVRAVDLASKQSVCLKIIKNEKDFFDQSLDEVKVLKLIKAKQGDEKKNCLGLLDFFYWREHLILVTELLLENLYEFSKFNRCLANAQPPFFTMGHLQKLTQQILVALEFVHGDLGLIHSDLKPENILFKSYSRCEAKVIDFGSACFSSGDKLGTYVQSRCYRAPEVILGCLPYNSKIDMWSLGCIIAELWTGFVLFQNDSCQSLLARVMGIIGPFPAWMLKSGKNVSKLFNGKNELFVNRQILVPKRTSLFQRMRVEDEAFLDFLSQLLQIDPSFRITATQALAHPWLACGRYSDGL